MTIEELRSEIESDDIFDAFEELLGFCADKINDFKSQQCKNCQYWDKVEQNYNPRQYGDCQRHVQCTPSHLTAEDFGCNKFKEK